VITHTITTLYNTIPCLIQMTFRKSVQTLVLIQIEFCQYSLFLQIFQVS